MRRALWMATIVLALAVAPAAAEFKPTVTPFGQIYASYQYNISGYEDYDARFPQNDYNGFDLTRSYLGLNGNLNEMWSANVTFNSRRDMKYETISVSTGVADDPATADVDESMTTVLSTTGTRSGQYTAYMRFAYATFQPCEYFGVSFGQVMLPIYANYAQYWQHAYIVNDSFFLYGLTRAGSEDLGVTTFGKLPKNYGYWGLSFSNGEGGSAPEADAGKNVQFTLGLRPLQVVDALKGLTLWGSYNYDKVQPDHPEELRTAYRAQLSYRYDVNDGTGFLVAADTGSSTTRIDVNGVDDVVAQYVAGWADVWFLDHYGVVLRYDSNDPNTDNDKDTGVGYQDETNMILAAFYVKPIKNVRLALDYKSIGYTAEIVDDNGDDVAKQPDQYLGVHTDVKF